MTCLLTVVSCCMSLAYAGLSSPQSESALYELGVSDYRQKKYLEALEEFSNLLYLNPKTAYGDQARNYIGEIVQKIKEIEAKQKMSPRERAQIVELAKRKVGRRDSNARRILAEVRGVAREVRRSPQQILAILSNSKLLSDSEQISAAKELEGLVIQRWLDNIQETLKAQIQNSGSSNLKFLHQAKGFLWLYEGDLENAIREWEQSLRLDPYDEVLKNHLSKAKLSWQLQKHNEEIQHLLSTGKDYYKVGDYNKALGGFKRLLHIDPANVEGLRYLKLTQAGMDQIVRQELINAKLDQAHSQLRHGSMLEAVQALVEVLELEPDNERARRHLADIRTKFSRRTALVQSGNSPNTAKQENKAKPLPQRAPNRADAENAYTVGMMHYMQGDLAQAQLYFEKAAALDPSFEQALRAEDAVRQESKR